MGWLRELPRSWFQIPDKSNVQGKTQVPPRFELGLQDSESWVLTITPWDLYERASKRVNEVVE